jgi:hypothetical protein
METIPTAHMRVDKVKVREAMDDGAWPLWVPVEWADDWPMLRTKTGWERGGQVTGYRARPARSGEQPPWDVAGAALAGSVSPNSRA